jgi:sugar lactone lactonase YvrE
LIVLVGVGILSIVRPAGASELKIDAYTGGPGAGGALTIAIAPRSVVQRGGSIFVADESFSVVRRIDVETGRATIVAGDGTSGFSGDGGPAVEAQLNGPTGLDVTARGDVFIADTRNNRIRVVDAITGVITTIAGNGEAGFSGDGGPATSGRLRAPSAVLLAGQLLIADSGNARIRAVTGDIISTVVGGGTSGLGDGAQPMAAQLGWPAGLAVGLDGSLLISDIGHNRVRRVSWSGPTISTIAGNGQEGYGGDNQPATNAKLSSPWGVVADSSGAILIADSGNHRVRRIDPSTSVITTVVGVGTPGFSGDGGAAAAAQLSGPLSIALDDSGRLLIADSSNNRLRRVDFGANTIGSIAGNGTSGFSGDEGAALEAQIGNATGLQVDDGGKLLIADPLTGHVREVDEFKGTIRTLATLHGANDLAIAANGDIYVAQEELQRISRIDGATGSVETFFDGVSFRPRGIAVGPSGDLFVADLASGDLLRIDHVTRSVSTFSGGSFIAPSGVAIDGAGNVLVADGWGFRVWRVDATTHEAAPVAGTGERGSAGDAGPATEATIGSVYRIVVDRDGGILIADTDNSRIRRVDVETGLISTIAGDGTRGYSGDGGPAYRAQLSLPYGLAADRRGALYVADNPNHRIRKIDFECEASCGACVEINRARLRIAGFSTGAGDDRLRFHGRVSSLTDRDIDPIADGLRISVGADGVVPLMDVALPPGPYSSDTGSGWRLNARGTSYSFQSRVPIGGAVDRVTIGRRASDPNDTIRILVKGTRGSLAVGSPERPVAVTVAVGEPSAAASLCAKVEFDESRPPGACRSTRAGDTLICR